MRGRLYVVVIMLFLIMAMLVGIRAVLGLGRRLPKGDAAIVVVLKTTGPEMEFWQIVRAGMDAAAKEFSVMPEILGPRYEKNVTEQMQILDGVINRHPSAILLAAADYDALVPLVEKAVAAGIRVVTLDSGVNSAKVASFIATDNLAAGKMAGKEMASIIQTGKDLAVISHLMGVATSIDREQGVRSAFGAVATGAILDTFYCQNDLEIAYKTAEWLLKERPNVGGIIALNETATLGSARAVRDAGKSGKIKIVGFDSSLEEIKLLESGVVQALVVQRPFNMGYLGIRTIVQLLSGEQVPKYIDTGSVLVRKNNMYSPENQKLLFPFLER